MDILELKDAILIKVEGAEKGSGEVIFFTLTGEKYRMYHQQDCCENVYLCDVVGDIEDLIGNHLEIAEEVSSGLPEEPAESYDDSFTWTYYRFATWKGSVEFRWYGSSNGYYSESVYVEQVFG